MPKVLRMPSLGELRRGAHREFVEELFDYYRAAGRPTLRKIAAQAREDDKLAGTASPETVRRVLVGQVQPTWPTTEAILHALCALSSRNPYGDRWPDENYRDDGPTTREEHLRFLWNQMIDEVPGAPATDPWAARGSADPWATATGSTEEPPF